jgi:hypothetical protein
MTSNGTWQDRQRPVTFSKALQEAAVLDGVAVADAEGIEVAGVAAARPFTCVAAE